MAHTLYENQVLENKIEDILTTSIDVNSYMTIDNSLTQEAGMKKTVHTYVASGEVEDVAEGVGNTKDIGVSFTSKEYDVVTTQGRLTYTDEQEMQDPMVVEVGLKGIADTMTNDLTKKAFAEFDKATLTADFDKTGITFDNVVDAIAKLPSEDESGLFLIISPSQKAALRKNLGEELKYSEGFARTGYIGTVCGVPVVVSKACPANKAYLATNEAVTAFVKKGSEIEQDRDKNTRTNTVYARKVMVVALTNAKKIVKLTQKTA
jgi:hypothetical protein|nr:MAG TPA: capsid protein [Caudoviricetes sp.]